MAAKSIRKSVSFDDSDGDRALLDAIAQALTSQSATELQSFSDLCKQALRQYLLSREPTPSVMLFMELQQQIAQLQVRVATLEEASAALNPSQTSPSVPQTHGRSEQILPQAADETEESNDPVLNRLGPLLDDF
ncbi:hypothetical protein IQ260_26460 [Leptolyngbya cf. ectocarpi LEGE 11479]|uniref:Plasmid segregation centromere-binding protein ParR n=1 Tax=Leptolyngbya cf. ectocarpi LEGE 11479 TaxID=1828722 RepID=A0A928ZZ59_LEPEC|nr:hypothetical protein [Leptolyngbya ectocarpi]MBE9070189.1 hypothetical protein [Leptolyngbya cf. ectocarpi LEGE 11479]